MKKLLLTILSIAPLCSFAEVEGGYTEIQAGSANSSAYNAGVDNSGVMRIDAGVKLDQYFGLEAGFSGLTKPMAGNEGGALQFYDASVKGILPLGDVFALHGQLGAAYAVGATNLSNFDATPKALVGVGADFNLNKNVALTVNDYGYLSPNLAANSGAGGNTNMVTGGVKINF